jgi:hypothetical protein
MPIGILIGIDIIIGTNYLISFFYLGLAILSSLYQFFGNLNCYRLEAYLNDHIKIGFVVR